MLALLADSLARNQRRSGLVYRVDLPIIGEFSPDRKHTVTVPGILMSDVAHPESTRWAT